MVVVVISVDFVVIFQNGAGAVVFGKDAFGIGDGVCLYWGILVCFGFIF